MSKVLFRVQSCEERSFAPLQAQKSFLRAPAPQKPLLRAQVPPLALVQAQAEVAIRQPQAKEPLHGQVTVTHFTHKSALCAHIYLQVASKL
jgi:hypothetical protein